MTHKLNKINQMTLSLTSLTFLPKAYSHFGLKRKMGMKRGGLLNMRNIDQALPFHTFCLAPLFVRASKLLSAHQSSNMLNRFELDFFCVHNIFQYMSGTSGQKSLNLGGPSN